MNNFREILLHPLVLIGAVLIAIALGVLSIISIGYSDSNAPPGYPTAVLRHIEAPTLTPTGIILPTAEATTTPETDPAHSGETLTIGSLVQITGTDGDGLNLRSEPGLESQILYLGIESEVFEVRDGPQEVNGVTWWYLVGFQDESRNGWGAADFLEVFQSQ